VIVLFYSSVPSEDGRGLDLLRLVLHQGKMRPVASLRKEDVFGSWSQEHAAYVRTN